MVPDALSTIGKYRIEGVLGRGAMSTVYRGVEEDGNRLAANKVLRTDILAEQEREASVTRFRREAELGRRLDHPRIVRVFDYGDIRGDPYLSMELLVGKSLADLLQGPRLRPIHAAYLVSELLDALAYIHAQGIIHRDIKPGNIMVRADGHVSLTDFGIARVSGSEMTQMGDMLGTPAYMAPEQLTGEGVDSRTDLFAAGIVLYALITRRRPFNGTVATVMNAIMTEHPLPPSRIDHELPAALDRVVARALEKSPEKRYQTAGEFAADLRRVMPALAKLDVSAGTAGEKDGDSAGTSGSGPARSGREAVPPKDVADKLAAIYDRLIAEDDGTASDLDEAEIARIEQAEASWSRWADADKESLQPLVERWPADLDRMAELIVTGAPVPRAAHLPRADWMALVRLAAVSLRFAHRLGQVRLVRAHHRRLCDELVESFIIYIDTAGAMLSTDDNPDLSRLSMDLLRLDVIEMALEALSAAAELRVVRKARILVAMQAMRKVNDTVAGYTETGDMLARFDVALIMSEVEELIAIASRLTDDSALPAGRQLRKQTESVITDFVIGADKLAAMTVEELHEEAAVAQTRVFTAKLRQVQSLYHFAIRLPGEGHRGPLGRFADSVHGQVDVLARHLMTMPDASEALSAVYDCAHELGWNELAQAILRHLKSQR